MSYPYNDLIVIVADVDGFTVKRILMDNGSSYNMLIWETTLALQVNLEKLRKIGTPFVGIGGTLVKMEGNVKLPITLGEKD